MYSVVLATVLMAGNATPAWGHHHRGYCGGCYCSSYCYSGYSGYSGYAGYAGHGWHGCHGCYSSCFGGCGCYHGPHFGHFHTFTPLTPLTPFCSCSCSGGYYYGSCYCSAPVCCSSAPRVVPVPDTKKSEPIPTPKKGGEQVSTTTKTSQVIVTLPADARLWVDNVECPYTSSERTFNTPPLDPNHRYVYNLRVEMMRDGQPISQTQRVVIVPGEPVRVDFNSAVASR